MTEGEFWIRQNSLYKTNSDEKLCLSSLFVFIPILIQNTNTIYGAATRNRTGIEGSTNPSVNRYTIAAMYVQLKVFSY